MRLKKVIFLTEKEFNIIKDQYNFTLKQMKMYGYTKEKEKHIQANFVQYMRSKYPYVICEATPNGGTNNQRLNVNNKKLGMLNGSSDIKIMYKGKVLCFEFKRDTKAPVSKAQEEYAKRCLKAGIPYYIVYTSDEAIAKLEEWLQSI